MTDDKLIKNTRRPTTATDKEASTTWCSGLALMALPAFCTFVGGLEGVGGRETMVTNFGKQNITCFYHEDMNGINFYLPLYSIFFMQKYHQTK